MRTSKKIWVPFIFLLLIITFTLMLKFKFEKEILQRNIDLAYMNAISNSMEGLAMDYSSIDNNEKVQLYYKTLYNLETAINVFESTSYEEYNDLFFSLNNLYHYLLQNPNDNFEINNKKYIYDFLTNTLISPGDNPKIHDFNKVNEIQN